MKKKIHLSPTKIDHDRTIGSKHWYQDSVSHTSAKRRNILPERYRKLFCNKQIVCIEYSDITDRDEREIFQRVQLGMALTPAEKLGVVKTPRADFIRYLQNRFFNDDDPSPTQSTSSTTSLLSWDRSRGNDFRCLATALYSFHRYQTSATPSSSTPTIILTPTIMQLEKWLSDKTIPVEEDLSILVSNAFEILSSLPTPSSPSPSYTKQLKRAVNPPKIAPIEFITIALMVIIVHPFIEPEEILKKVGDMRENVRKEHVDIRMNSKVGKTLAKFVEDLVKQCGAFQHEKNKPKPELKSKSRAKTKPKPKPTPKPKPKPTAKGKEKEKKKVEVEVESEDEEEIDELMEADSDPPPSLATTNNATSHPSSSSSPSPLLARQKQTVRKSSGGHVPRKIIRPTTPESPSASTSGSEDQSDADSVHSKSKLGPGGIKRKISTSAEVSDKPAKLSKTSWSSTPTPTPSASVGLAAIRQKKALYLQKMELEKAAKEKEKEGMGMGMEVEEEEKIRDENGVQREKEHKIE